MTTGDAAASAPDALLLGWARDGSSDAFFELWLRHEDFANRVAHGLTRTPHDRADLVATTRDAVWRALANGCGPSVAFRAYVSVAMRNLASRGYARVDDLMPEFDDVAKPDGQLSDAAFSLVDLSDAMARAFATLSDRHREVLLLSEVDELTPGQIGVHFGISANAASQLAVRARQTLRYAWIDAHMADRPLTTHECVRFRAIVRRVVAGDATADEVADLDEHVVACGACRDAYVTAGDAGFVRRSVGLLVLGPAMARFASGRHRRRGPRPDPRVT